MQIRVRASVHKRPNVGQDQHVDRNEWREDGTISLVLVRDLHHHFGCNIEESLLEYLQNSRAEVGFYAIGEAQFLYTGPVLISFLETALISRKDGRYPAGTFVKYNSPNGSIGVVVGDGSDERYYVRWYYGKDVKGEPMTGSYFGEKSSLKAITMEEFNVTAGREGWGDR